MSGVAIDSSDLSPDAERAERAGLDRLDPRTRIVAAFAFVIAVVATTSIPVLIAFVLLAFALVLLTGQPFRALRRRLVHIEGFIVVLFLLMPFTMPGDAFFSIGPLVASKQGVLRTVMLALKVNAAAVGIFVFIGSMEPVRLGGALARLGVPGSLVHLLLFTVRFGALFRKEISRLLEAMRARAFHPRSNWHTWRSYGNLAGMMLIRSFERAERVDEAMRCRAFSGRFSLAIESAMTWRDVWFFAATLLVLTALVVVGRVL